MQSNLEDIPFDAVADETGMTYTRFREQLSPRYSKVWRDIGKGYFFLVFFTGSCILLDYFFHVHWWIFVVPLAFLIGYTAAYLALFIHEAGHYNIHPSKKQNDRLARWLLCLLFGLDIHSYRKIHWQHHLHLGTPQDTETSYFHHLSDLFILESLTGIHLLRTMRKKSGPQVLNEKQQAQSRQMLLLGAGLHLLLLATVAWLGYWVVAICWLLAFGIFFPFFATIRQLLEHRDELAKAGMDFTKTNHGKLSRLFVHSVLSSSFGAAGFTRHLVHHWDPQLSYTRLGDAERFLRRASATASIMQVCTTTYFSTFKKLRSAR